MYLFCSNKSNCIMDTTVWIFQWPNIQHHMIINNVHYYQGPMVQWLTRWAFIPKFRVRSPYREFQFYLFFILGNLLTETILLKEWCQWKSSVNRGGCGRVVKPRVRSFGFDGCMFESPQSRIWGNSRMSSAHAEQNMYS